MGSKDMMKSIEFLIGCLRFTDWAIFRTHTLPKQLTSKNPRETFFLNFYVKKFLPIKVLCAERDSNCVTNLCKKVLSPFLDFFSVSS